MIIVQRIKLVLKKCQSISSKSAISLDYFEKRLILIKSKNLVIAIAKFGLNTYLVLEGENNLPENQDG